MALCLANSLVTKGEFNPYDQLVRYKWWWKNGYMSSTGECFDIGKATKESIETFCRRQERFIQKINIPETDIDYLDDPELLAEFNVKCSQPDVAGNGALMRLAPVPLFFFRYPAIAVEYSGISGEITHGDRKAYDACRYYAALIVGALRGYSKKQLLDERFYSANEDWFSGKPLCPEIRQIAEGSFKRPRGYDDGIRGTGYVVNALEAALWAFWFDNNSFEQGALAAVNLGDDTDTTAAIYGQLAGAYYGYKQFPEKWLKHVYAHKFMTNLSKWIVYEGGHSQPPEDKSTQQLQHDESKIPKTNNKSTTKAPLINESKATVPKPVPNPSNRTQHRPTNTKASGSKSTPLTGKPSSNRTSSVAPKPQNNLHTTRSIGASRSNPSQSQASPVKSNVRSDPTPKAPKESTHQTTELFHITKKEISEQPEPKILKQSNSRPNNAQSTTNAKLQAKKTSNLPKK